MTPVPNVKYKLNNNDDNAIKNIINQTKLNNDSNDDNSIIFSEKIVFGYIGFILICIIICSVFISESKYEPNTINSLKNRLLK